MSFDLLEQSLAAGQPRRLYEFRRGVSRWSYVSGTTPFEYGSRVFMPLRGGIIDDGIRQSGDARVDMLQITAPASIEVAQLYRGMPPSQAVPVTVWDVQADGDVRPAWSGEIRSVTAPALDRRRINCSPLSARMSQTGLRLCWERACPHTVFSPECGVNKLLYRVDATVQYRDARVIKSAVLAGYGDGWFSRGYVEWQVGTGEYDTRMIQHHVGDTLTLLGGTEGVPLGAAHFYAGCDQRITTCHDKFGNHLWFGGIPHLAGSSPFSGNPVF